MYVLLLCFVQQRWNSTVMFVCLSFQLSPVCVTFVFCSAAMEFNCHVCVFVFSAHSH